MLSDFWATPHPQTKLSLAESEVRTQLSDRSQESKSQESEVFLPENTPHWLDQMQMTLIQSLPHQFGYFEPI